MTSSPPTLVDMPKVVMEHILGKLELRSIITLRKVCTTLRDFIDTNDSLPQLQDLSIYVHADNIEVWYYALSGMDAVDYRSPDDKTTRVTYGSTVKTIQGIDYFDSFLMDFKFFISRQKGILKQFRVTRYFVDVASEKDTVPHRVIEEIGKVLKDRPRPLPAEELYIGVLDQEELMKILPFLEIKKLTVNSNSYGKQELEMEQVLKTEQWGNLENLLVDNFCLDIPIRELHHLGFVNLKVKRVEVEDLVELKKVFLATTKPKEFVFTYKTFENSERLLEAFGPPEITRNVFGLETQAWRTPYSESDNSKVLEIHHSRDWIKFTNLENFQEKVRKIRKAAGQNLQDFLY